MTKLLNDSYPSAVCKADWSQAPRFIAPVRSDSPLYSIAKSPGNFETVAEWKYWVGCTFSVTLELGVAIELELDLHEYSEDRYTAINPTQSVFAMDKVGGYGYLLWRE